MSEEPKLEFVPYDKADLEKQAVSLLAGVRARLSDGRWIEVWQLKEVDGLSIRICRPTRDGKISKLEFGLNRDAGKALLDCLLEMFHPGPETMK